MRNHKIPGGLVLWLVALILVVFAVVMRPSRQELSQNQHQLTTIKRTYQAEKTTLKENTPLKDNFDLPKAQAEATQRLSQAFSTGLGGIHSDDDWKDQQALLKDNLGTNLTDVVYHHAYSTESKKYVIDKNNQTLVAFEDVDNKHDAIIKVVVQYAMVGGGDATYLYTLHYDLTNQQVKRYNEQALTE